MTIMFSVEFAEHVPLSNVSSMATTLSKGSSLFSQSGDRSFRVVSKHTNFTYLRDQLTKWERCGFLHWTEE